MTPRLRLSLDHLEAEFLMIFLIKSSTASQSHVHLEVLPGSRALNDLFDQVLNGIPITRLDASHLDLEVVLDLH